MKKIYLTLLSIFLLCSFVCATLEVSPSSKTINANPGDSKDVTFTFTADSNTTFMISKGAGSIGSWVEFSKYDFSLQEGETAFTTMTINIPEDAQAGSYTITPSFGDVTATITLNVEGEQQVSPSSSCNIDIFPTILTNVKVKQGDSKTRNIQLTVPSCYSSPLTVQGVALQTDEQPIQLGELNLGTIQPGNSVQIPIEINAEGISTGQYSDTLQFLLYNSTGNKINVPSVSISVLVSAGIQPITNFSFSELPTCSLDSIELNLNNTYKLTCTNTNPNIQINPVINDQMIKGIAVEETSSQYIYKFKPIKIGTTEIIARFLYKNAQIGTPFRQEIKISPSGNSAISGINMKFEFIPDLDSAGDGEEIIVHAVDNKTNSYIENAKIYLDGVLINNSFIIQARRNYTLRATAPGYLDYVQNIYINPKPIKIELNPSSGWIEGEQIQITTTPPNASLFYDGVKLDGNIIENPTAGNHTIEAIYQGYQTTIMNISVSESVSIISNPEFKKGVEQVFVLSREADWQVLYAKNSEDMFQNYLNGTGDKIVFTPKKEGVYQIKINGNVKYTKELKGFSITSFFNHWYWYIVFGLIIVIIIYVVRKRGGGGIYLPKEYTAPGTVSEV